MKRWSTRRNSAPLRRAGDLVRDLAGAVGLEQGQRLVDRDDRNQERCKPNALLIFPDRGDRYQSTLDDRSWVERTIESR